MPGEIEGATTGVIRFIRTLTPPRRGLERTWIIAVKVLAGAIIIMIILTLRRPCLIATARLSNSSSNKSLSNRAVAASEIEEKEHCVFDILAALSLAHVASARALASLSVKLEVSAVHASTSTGTWKADRPAPGDGIPC